MDESIWVATTFEDHRPRLTALATRMLGSKTEADDALQEAWLRFSRSDTSSVDNLGAWLTTVVSRVCLNALKARRTRSSNVFEVDVADALTAEAESDPEREALLSDSVGLALMVVLENLTPTERVAFVLHDVFAIPFEEIAPIVGCNPAAARQLASRARRRVRCADAADGPDRLRQSRLVDAFLAAARRGDLSALVGMLDPDAVLRCDAAAAALGGLEEARGAELVASFSRRARGARPALVDGAPAAAWLPRGQLRVALLFTFSDDRIATIEAVADPNRLALFDIVLAGEPIT